MGIFIRVCNIKTCGCKYSDLENNFYYHDGSTDKGTLALRIIYAKGQRAVFQRLLGL